MSGSYSQAHSLNRLNFLCGLLLQPLELACHGELLHGAHLVHQQDAAQVIDLVLKAAGEEALSFDDDRKAVFVQRPDAHPGGTLDLTGLLIAARVVQPTDQITIISANGVALRQKISEIPKSGRSARGSRLINLRDGDGVAGVARLADVAQSESIIETA